MKPCLGQGTLALAGLAFTVMVAACALPFPDYDLEQQGTTTTGAGGAGGAAVAGAIGSQCESDDECLDGHCLESNTEDGSVCCATECPIEEDQPCGRNGKCDASGADCALYPAGTTCDDATCADGVLVSAECQAAKCGPGASTACDGGLDCADGSTCALTCKTGAECANPADETPGAVCAGGECTERPAGAPCNSNTQCESGACGTTGAGRCCSNACPVIDGPCGPTDCDSEGECVFPNEEMPCGTEPSCVSGNLATVYCNGEGSCSVESTEPCAGHLACASPTSCYASCESNDATGDQRCPSGYWCDGSTCQQASWDEGTACLRDGQCSSNDCTPAGFCAAAGCDVDNDGYVRDDPHCVGTDEHRDCDDNDARAFPGQTEFFDTPRSLGGYDFDCDTVEEPKHATSCNCGGYALLVPAGASGCGVTGNIRSCYPYLFFFCGVSDSADTATQLCR